MMARVSEEAASSREGLRTFGALLVARTLSVLGTNMTAFALNIWVFQRHGRVSDLTILACLTSLPLVFLYPIGGVLADRVSRRALLMVVDIVLGAISLLIMVLIATGVLEVWHLYLLAFATNICNASLPAASSWPALLVAPRHVARAVATIELGGALTILITPMLAAVIITRVGTGGVLGFDAATFFVGAAVLATLRLPRRINDQRPQLWRDVREAVHYLRGRPALALLCGLDAVVLGLCSALGVLLTPLMLTGGTPLDVGAVLTSAALGTLVAAGLATWSGRPRRRARAVVVCVGVVGVAMLGAAGAGASLPLFGAVFAVGACMPTVTICVEALIQRTVEIEIQGRIFGLLHAARTLLLGICYLATGFVADVLLRKLFAVPEVGALVRPLLGSGTDASIRGVYALAGGLMLVVGAIVVGYRPLRQLDDADAEVVVALTENG